MAGAMPLSIYDNRCQWEITTRLSQPRDSSRLRCTFRRIGPRNRATHNAHTAEEIALAVGLSTVGAAFVAWVLSTSVRNGPACRIRLEVERSPTYP